MPIYRGPIRFAHKIETVDQLHEEMRKLNNKLNRAFKIYQNIMDKGMHNSPRGKRRMHAVRSAYFLAAQNLLRRYEKAGFPKEDCNRHWFHNMPDRLKL